jgi:hypothetical protein
VGHARALALLAVGGALLLGACGGGGGSEARADETGGDSGGRRSRGEPEATDPEVVAPYVEELLADHDRVVNEIMAEPQVAADRDHDLVQEYVRLYEPGSDFVEGALDTWVAQDEEGVSILPYDDAHPAHHTRLHGEIEVVARDEVRAPFCLAQRQITYRDGEVVEGLPLLERQGEATVVRVEGEWRLRERQVFGDRTGCDEDEEVSS